MVGAWLSSSTSEEGQTQRPSAKTQSASHRAPWNKGEMVDAKPPLRTMNVWSIRTNLQVAGRIRDLAMFNLAIDSKSGGCDVVSLWVDNVAPQGMGSIVHPFVRRKPDIASRSN